MKNAESEIKRLEATLQKNGGSFHDLVQVTSDWIWQIDAHGTYVYASPKVRDFLGYEPEEVYGKTPFDFMSPAEAKRVGAIFGAFIEAKKPFSFLENIALHKDGHKVVLETSGVPLIDRHGDFRGYFGIDRDVTAHKAANDKIRRLNTQLKKKIKEAEAHAAKLAEAQEALVRREKLAVLGQVAGSVGHELRNPLGVMNNAVYYLQTVLADADDTVKEYLDIIKEEIARSDRIVGDLLDSVRIKPPQPETAGIAEMIGLAIRKSEVPDTVKVVQEIPDDAPPVVVDPLQIHQVLRNLISNAVEAMPDGGTLTLRVLPGVAGGFVGIEVRDSGVGMSREQMGHLFQPLFTTKARGIGLGLVVIKNLTESNGGKVAVQSKPGKGTCFTITLPCQGPPA